MSSLGDTPREFRDQIRHPDLVRLYDYWATRRGTRNFPARADLDPVEFSFALGNVTLVDVLYDPLRFRFRLVGTLMAQRMGWDLTGRMVDEIPDAKYRDSVIQGFRKVIEARRPNTTLYEREVERRPRRFEVLRLPLAADGETIDMLLLCPMFFEPLPQRSPVAGPLPGPGGAPKVIEES